MNRIMTVLRRQRGGIDGIPGKLGCLGILRLLLILALFGAMTDKASAAVTELIVTDRLSGLAIGGFDPVAYFTDGTPQLGREAFETYSQGATWRFRNEGNRDAFIANPEVYTPQFGGYDPIAVGRGVGTAGEAKLWLISAGQLYLFYNAEAREKFAADPAAAIAAAQARWPDVLKTLSP